MNLASREEVVVRIGGSFIPEPDEILAETMAKACGRSIGELLATLLCRAAGLPV